MEQKRQKQLEVAASQPAKDPKPCPDDSAA
jgi:hypothetical protein